MIRTRFAAWLMAACLFLPAFAAAQLEVFVATWGLDSNPGTKESPFGTVEKALQSSAPVIYVSEGDFVVGQRITLGAGRVLSGGHGSDFFSDSIAVTRLYLTSGAGEAGLVMQGGSRAEFLTLAEGYWSVEAQGNAVVHGCVFEGAETASLRVRSAAAPTIERCQFRGGLTGLEVSDTANAVVRDCLFEDQQSRGLFARGSASVSLIGCHLRTCAGEAAGFFQTSTGLVENCLIERNVLSGLRVQEASPVIRGNVIALNSNGVQAEGGSTAAIYSNTLARNRLSGIVVSDSKPRIEANILAENQKYGIEETSGTVGGSLLDNFFWLNTTGAYLDGGTTVTLTEQALETQLENDGETTGNQIANPLFESLDDGDYRLMDGSPALDRVAAIDVLHATDAAGNHRVVDTPGQGNGGEEVLDIGAIERGDNRFRDFGPLKYGWNILDSIAPFFDPVVVQDLPGRYRLGADAADHTHAVGFIDHADPMLEQSKGTVMIGRYRLSGDGRRPTPYAPQTRLRHNALGSQVISLVADEAVLTLSQVPRVDSRDYYILTDLQQAGLKDLTTTRTLSFMTSFDWVDIYRPPNGSAIGVNFEEIEFAEVDRGTFDAQFTEAFTFDFNDGLQGWTFFDVAPFFDLPFARWNAQRGALEAAIPHPENFPNTYGSWESPNFQLLPGDLVRIAWNVATNEPQPGKTPAFRLRLTSRTFEYTSYIVIDPTLSEFPEITPSNTGREFVTYAYIPPTMPPDVLDYYISFELFGFSFNQGGGSIYLNGVRVETAHPAAFPPPDAMD